MSINQYYTQRKNEGTQKLINLKITQDRNVILESALSFLGNSITLVRTKKRQDSSALTFHISEE